MMLRRAPLALAAALMLAPSALAQASPPPLASQTPQQIVQTLDRNGDGALQPGEVAGSDLQADYSRLDTNRDGRLTPDEILSYRRQFGTELQSDLER